MWPTPEGLVVVLCSLLGWLEAAGVPAIHHTAYSMTGTAQACQHCPPCMPLYNDSLLCEGACSLRLDQGSQPRAAGVQG